MKSTSVSKRLIALLTVVVSFTLLFFKAWTPGLNWFVFTIVCAAVPWFVVPKLERSTYILPSVALAITGFSVFSHANTLAILSALGAFWFLAARFVNPKLEPLMGVAVGFFNLLLSPIGMFVRFFQRLQTKNTGFRKIMGHLVIPGILLVVFGTLYYHSSPTFQSLIERFKWDELPEFVLTSILGILVASVLLYSFVPEKITANFQRKSERLIKGMGGEGMTTSWKLGIWAVVFLLAIVVSTDFYYKINGSMPDGLNYSAYLHQGVFSLIVSIVFSALISVLTTNYLSKSPSKGMLAANYSFLGVNMIYVWQNIFRNQAYVNAHGLTEKRIVIYFYLAFCVVGLLLTVYTIYRNRPIGFLYQSCSYMVFSVIVVCTLFNWSRIITQHNMDHIAENTGEVDHYYLLTLDRSNLPILYKNRDRFSDEITRRIEADAEMMAYDVYGSKDFREMRLGKELTKRELKQLMNLEQNKND